MANLCLDGDLRVAKSQRLRYQLLHVPARITRSGRRWRLAIQHDWPWATRCSSPSRDCAT